MTDPAPLPPYARTADEWWTIINAIWPDIFGIFEKVGFDLNETIYVEDNHAEAVIHDRPFAANMERLKAARDPRLALWLQRAWGAAPDHPSIHDWSGWGRLCDLCSESHVLDPEMGREIVEAASVHVLDNIANRK